AERGDDPPRRRNPDAATLIGSRPASTGRRARRRRRRRGTVLFEARSALSGRIRVVQRGPERRLMIGGEIQSVYFPGGDWAPAEREYWARALAPARPPPLRLHDGRHLVRGAARRRDRPGARPRAVAGPARHHRAEPAPAAGRAGGGGSGDGPVAVRPARARAALGRERSGRRAAV